jgi:hypothetical protein
MKKVSAQMKDLNLSYELYKELANEICAPISDKDLTLDLRFELYKSKLIYLYNINEQCFRSINSPFEKREFDYTHEDLRNIREAIEITREFIRQTILESLMINIQTAEVKGLHASRFQKNS